MKIESSWGPEPDWPVAYLLQVVIFSFFDDLLTPSFYTTKRFLKHINRRKQRTESLSSERLRDLFLLIPGNRVTSGFVFDREKSRRKD